MVYLGIFAGLEERCDACEAILVVPHDGVGLAVSITRKAEVVFEHCMKHQYGLVVGNRSVLTVEPIPSSLLQKVLLVAGVWYVPGVIADRSSCFLLAHFNLELLMFAIELVLVGLREACWLLVELEDRKVDCSPQAVGEGSVVLGQLLPFPGGDRGC